MLESRSRTLRIVRREPVMKSTTTTALVAAGALLVGGIATAAFMKSGSSAADPVAATQTRPTLDTTPLADDGARTDAVAIEDKAGKLEYADIVKVDPLTKKEKAYARPPPPRPRMKSVRTWWCRNACPSAMATSAAPSPVRSSAACWATRWAVATARKPLPRPAPWPAA
jgi:hypothetical protein